MKFCVSLALMVAICCNAAMCAMDPESAQIVEACTKEHEVNPQEFSDFLGGKLKGAAVKDNIRCSIQCFMEKKGIMDQSHKFKPDVAKEKMAHFPNFVEAMEQCKDKSGPAPCETAFLITECLMEKKVPMS